ncbi:hypothetical protein P167DRAFT_525664 [Morchella conica CCBAS932]|uniref:Atos-like conserved domain-containing protein n=1 Tax=Morchella conica CCBAS932 TaxID=1392247 RepID=A0A3N4KJ86_9PEZI|nr:hypothetical protein P167DRAFT_525664 [Morchella conica CCBAS932]
MPLVYHHHRNPSPPLPPQPPEVAGESSQVQLKMHSHDPSPTDSPPTFPSTTPSSLPEIITSSRVTDRAELIERIKAGQTSTWVPNRSLSNYNYHTTHSPEQHFIDEHPDRPHSALHQGVFVNEFRNSQIYPQSPILQQSSPLSLEFKSLFSTNPSSVSPRTIAFGADNVSEIHQARTRQRAPSFSNFVLKAPTSPLVHSSNPDNDNNENNPLQTWTEPIAISTSKSEKRFPVPASPLSSLQLSPSAPLNSRQSFGSGTGSRRISENWQELPSPSVSSRQTRRLSGFANSTSDLPFGSFVGSYEESILNGRMSTTPSKPLSFVAQIGVLGIGKCKASLRCPAHVTLPFPAYFYSVGDYDSPSPYVGQIDLDTALSAEKNKPSKVPPGVGGAYRIPQRGQLQIVIKNPNKTAVKLFLVPYDLKDMDAGTKTFIRQKSYSAGNALLSDLPQSSTVSMKREKEKDALRYLIHLHIVCPSRGRYYLHKSIRIVFANRVPDGKEKLRNEVLWPEPKFSPWKAENSTSTLTSLASHRKRRASYSEMVGVKGMPPSKDEEKAMLFTPSDIEMDHGKMMDLDSVSDVNGDAGEFEKMSVKTSLVRGEPHGLLARKLKSLGVEGGIIADGPLDRSWHE